METFDEVVAAGSLDEKRSLIRAFVSRSDADPQTGRSGLRLIGLPGIG
jgi:hypothetical protein